MTEKNVEEFFFRFKKVNIIGSENVGKTTLVQELFKTYTKNLNIEKFQYSVENNKMKLIDGLDKIKVKFENKTLNLYAIRTTIIDENFDFIKNNLKSLFFQSELIILMIDITNEESFNLITKLYSSSEDFNDKKILILSNKLDKDDERKISGFSIKEFVENNDNKKKKNNQIISFEISLINEKENFDDFIENLYNILYNINDSNIYDIIKIQDPPKLPKVINDLNIKDTYNLNLFLLGNSTVGKTSFKQRFFSNSFTENNILTIGVDFDRTMCQIGDKIVKLELCDTAGQERFRAIPRQHYSKADGFILIFDVCEDKTFKDVEVWIKDIIENTKGNIKINNNNNNNNNILSGKEISIFLVGNKIDNSANRVVSYKDGEDFAKLHGIKYCEISCKSGLNVYEVMTEIIMDSYINIRGDKSKSFKLLLKNNNKKKKDKALCC